MHSGDITDRGWLRPKESLVALSSPHLCTGLQVSPEIPRYHTVWLFPICKGTCYVCMLPNSEEMYVLLTKTHHLSPLLYGRKNLMTISLGPIPRLISAFLAIVAHLLSIPPHHTDGSSWERLTLIFCINIGVEKCVFEAPVPRLHKKEAKPSVAHGWWSSLRWRRCYWPVVTEQELHVWF